MTGAEHALLLVVLLVGAAGGYLLARHRRRSRSTPAPRRVLLPFAGAELPPRVLDAALRLARADGATLMPAYLAAVPMRMPLDCPLPAAAERALDLLEAIERRAEEEGVPVDSRIERGRSYRHALARLLERESFDRLVVPADGADPEGLARADLVWVLDHAPGEVLILRPQAASGSPRRRFSSTTSPPSGSRSSENSATETTTKL